MNETKPSKAPQVVANAPDAESKSRPVTTDTTSEAGLKDTDVPSNAGIVHDIKESGHSKVQEAGGEVAAKPVISGTTEATDDTGEAIQGCLRVLREEVAFMNSRIAKLETENFVLQKHVESLVQREERRRHLGTDSENTPFGVEVKDRKLRLQHFKRVPQLTHVARGNVLRVQGTSSLNVGDLIRRIRIKANIAPAQSQNPRIALGEQQLGHAMTLGEAGIQQDSVLLFTYDGGH